MFPIIVFFKKTQINIVFHISRTFVFNNTKYKYANKEFVGSYL